MSIAGPEVRAPRIWPEKYNFDFIEYQNSFD
jgi:hypothetical protein